MRTAESKSLSRSRPPARARRRCAETIGLESCVARGNRGTDILGRPMNRASRTRIRDRYRAGRAQSTKWRLGTRPDGNAALRESRPRCLPQGFGASPGLIVLGGGGESAETNVSLFRRAHAGGVFLLGQFLRRFGLRLKPRDDAANGIHGLSVRGTSGRLSGRPSLIRLRGVVGAPLLRMGWASTGRFTRRGCFS